VYNLAPPMAQMAEDHHVFFHAHQDSLGVGHWNVEGNRVAGELMANWLAAALSQGTLTDSSAVK